MRRTLALAGVVVVVIAAFVWGATVLIARGREPSLVEGFSDCSQVPAAFKVTLGLNLPSGWRLDRVVVVDMPSTSRPSDGAPVSVVAGWIVDTDGSAAYGAPALFMVEGGLLPEHGRYPKSFYVHNDIAADAYERGYAAMDETVLSRRRRIPDARAVTNRYPESHSAAVRAVECLGPFARSLRGGREDGRPIEVTDRGLE